MYCRRAHPGGFTYYPVPRPDEGRRQAGLDRRLADPRFRRPVRRPESVAGRQGRGLRLSRIRRRRAQIRFAIARVVEPASGRQCDVRAEPRGADDRRLAERKEPDPEWPGDFDRQYESRGASRSPRTPSASSSARTSALRRSTMPERRNGGGRVEAKCGRSTPAGTDGSSSWLKATARSIGAAPTTGANCSRCRCFRTRPTGSYGLPKGSTRRRPARRTC